MPFPSEPRRRARTPDEGRQGGEERESEVKWQRPKDLRARKSAGGRPLPVIHSALSSFVLYY